MKRLIDSIEHVRRRFSAHDRYDPRLFKKPAPRFEIRGKRILLAYPFSGLGDAVLLAPVVRALFDLEPKAVGLLIPPFAAKVWKTIDLPVRIHLLTDGIGNDRSRREQLERELLRKKYDAAVDLGLRDGIDVRAWLSASGASIRVGWVREGERLSRLGLDFGAPDVRRETILHWSRYTALPLACFGVERPRYEVPWKKDRAVEKRANALWGKRGPRILLIPGSRAEHKRAGSARFVSIGRAAREAWGASVTVSGSPTESKMIRGVAKAIGGGSKPYTGKNLVLLRELIASASAVVSNDTGPLHFAYLLEKPTIALFSYMSPAVWGPPKADPRFIVLNVRAGEASENEEGGTDVWSRLVLHHLEKWLDTGTTRA